MIEYEQARQLKQELGIEYLAHHSTRRQLRDYWHGRYWEQWRDDRSSIASLFRDIARGDDSPTAPDFRVVHNIIQEVCLKYQSFLSPLPMIRVYRDPGRKHGKQQATKKERYLYGLWNQRPTSMSAVLNRIAWYLPLMGDCFLGAFPDMEANCIRPVLRSPEYAYPIQGYDGQSLDAVMFSWETSQAKALRQFPKYNPDEGQSRTILRRKEKNPKVEILEYSDGNEFNRWVNGQRVNGVEHSYGFNLFDQIAFIFVPDEPWNHGAVEQAINLNVAENVLRSLLLQAVISNVFPKYVLIDPSKAPEELDMGDGAVWGINPGGDVKTLAPPLQALPIQQGFLADNERAIKAATSMPEASMGSFTGGMTHISGKAINEMQGAGTGSTIEMVQGLGIGNGMVSWNEKAICMGRKMFADEDINLAGHERGSMFDLSPRQFAITLKGKELVGSYRNEVVFSPHMDDHSKLIMGLQALGAGLVGKEHVRNQIGVPDSDAMDEEILGEQLQEIVLEAIRQELIAAPSGESAMGLEERGLAVLQGRVASGPASAPAALPPSPQSGPPIAELPGGGQMMGQALEMPPGAPLEGAEQAPPEPAAPDELIITLDEAVTAFQALPVSGRVFLVGEIVDGKTDDDIEVALTDSSDRQVIADGLPQYVGRLSFTTVSGEPKEQYVEVTPGAVPEPAGEEPDLDAILAGP